MGIEQEQEQEKGRIFETICKLIRDMAGLDPETIISPRETLAEVFSTEPKYIQILVEKAGEEVGVSIPSQKWMRFLFHHPDKFYSLRVGTLTDAIFKEGKKKARTP